MTETLQLVTCNLTEKKCISILDALAFDIPILSRQSEIVGSSLDQSSANHTVIVISHISLVVVTVTYHGSRRRQPRPFLSAPKQCLSQLVRNTRNVQ